ncbi:protein kinase [Archangium violaceum]|uniref:serine/threonine protein kinase n=1 Tax=Archangium violaceum TaxID=83451 RepID=UPI00194FFBC1|nr:serine/threonine-protein kinase [Archangium violaceum]QRN95140.1 protein kinase [Archangium violaceum]
MAQPPFIACPTCGLRVAQGTEKCPQDGTMLGDDPSAGKTRLTPAQPSPAVAMPAQTQPAMGVGAFRANPGSQSGIPSVADPLLGTQLGEYVIQEQIGIGGMGIVYRGEQPLIGKKVAIKVLRPDVGDQSMYVERLLVEARAVNAIRHRGIIDIFSFGKMPDGRQYFVMEYLEGTALDTWLDIRGPLSVHEAIRLSDEILDALTAAHEAGVIHRDLKPNNIFLARQPGGGHYVKVLDFGLAKQLSNNPGLSQQTLHGLIIGTPEYMAPEQVRGDPVSPKTDLYAFGIILFQLLTGQRPFTAKAPMEYLVHHLEHTPPSPLELKPELPPALARLVLRLLEKAPAARPSAEEVRASLQEILDGLPLPEGTRPSREMRSIMVASPEVRPASPRQEKPEVSAAPSVTPPRFPARLVAGVAAGLLLLTAGVAVLLRSPAPKPVATPLAAPVTEAPAKPTPAKPATELVANPSPAIPPPVVENTPPSPPPTLVETPSRASGPSKVNTERKPYLLTRIARLERKLLKSSLSADEQENARSLLKKARARAERASTADERKEVMLNLDIWERQYLRN